MRKLLKVFGVIVFVASISLWLAYRYYWEGVDTSNRKPAFTISTETTYLTGPLDSMGYVDYETALNERLRKGMKPEENAVVLLLKATGPNPERANLSDLFFQALSIPRPAKTPNDYVSQRNFATENWAASESRDPDFFQVDPPFMTRPWLAKDHPVCAEWLAKNTVALKYAEQASRCPKYYHPYVVPNREQTHQTLVDALLPNVQVNRDIAMAFACHAMMKTAEGKHDEAWADLLTIHRLARLQMQGGTLIEMLVGYSMEVIALDRDLAFLEHVQPSSDKIHKIVGDLQRLSAACTIGDKGLQGERIIHISILQQFHRGGFGILDALAGKKEISRPTRAKFAKVDDLDWNLIFQTSNGWFDRFEEIGRIADRTARASALKAIKAEILDLSVSSNDILQEFAEVQVFGSARNSRSTKFANTLARLVSPGLIKINDANDRREQMAKNFRVACALAAYKADNGRYPDKLDALKPKYLPTIPLDSFSGEQLIYEPDATGYLLYSVGINGEDEGGRSYSDLPRGDDLVIRMPLPPLKK